MATTFENKATKIRLGVEEDSKFLTYVGLLTGIIGRQAVDKAWTIDELKKRLDVVERLEAVDLDVESIEFNSSELALVKKEVEDAKWTIAHRDIVDFVEYVKSL